MIARNKKRSSWVGRLFGKDDTEDAFEDFNEMGDDVLDEADEDLEDELGEDIFDESPTPLARKNDAAEDLQINLLDKGDMLVAQSLVPGLDEDEIDVDLNREMLTITTSSNERCVETGGDYLYEELFFGSFARSILLPAEIEVEDSKAVVKDGILTVEMPKIDKAARKKLSIKKK